jgi:hypothetical protein
VPIGEKANGIPGESDASGILQGCLLAATIIPYPRAGDLFEVGLSILAGIETNDHLLLLFLAIRAEQKSLDIREFWWGG